MLEVNCYYYIPPRNNVGVQVFKVIHRENTQIVHVARIHGTDVGYRILKIGPLTLGDSSSNGRASIKIPENVIPKILALYT